MENTKLTKTLLTMIVMSMLVVGLGNLIGAQEDGSSEGLTEEEIGELKGDAGVTPGSAWYGFERFGEGVSLAFTFNKQKKAEKRMEYANERLLEAKETAEKNNTEGVEKALQYHNEIMEDVNKSVEDIEDGDDREELNRSIEKTVGLQRAIEVHSYKTEVLQERLSQNISEGKKKGIEKALNQTRKSVQNLERNLERKKQRTATRFRAVSGMNEEEAEKAIGKVEKKKGLRKAKEAIANDRTQRAEKEIGRIQKKLQERENKGMNVSGVDEKLQKVKEKLQEKRQNLSKGSEGDYGKSYEEIENSVKGIQRASNRLRNALEKAPENASKGLQTALENVESASQGLEKARNRAGKRRMNVSIPEDIEEQLPGEGGVEIPEDQKGKGSGDSNDDTGEQAPDDEESGNQPNNNPRNMQ